MIHMKKYLGIVLGALLFASPVAASTYYDYNSYSMPMTWCGSYYSYGSCVNYTYHNYSPYTYVAPQAYVSTSAYAYASAGVSTYPSTYSYPTYGNNNYYPQQYSYNYMYPYDNNGYNNNYQYGNNGYNNYSYNNGYNNGYSNYPYNMYTGNGTYCSRTSCSYPYQGNNSYQMTYNPWTGMWY